GMCQEPTSRISDSVPEMHPRPPTFTLFPYTTLFRSPGAFHFLVPVLTEPELTGRERRGLHEVDEAIGRDAEPRPADRFVNLMEADRKSTRLNSSHVAISYAVFCLKKKT